MWPFNRKKVQLLNIMGNIVRSDSLVGMSNTTTTKNADDNTLTCSFTVWLKSGQSFVLSVTDKFPFDVKSVSDRQVAALEESLEHDIFGLRTTIRAYMEEDCNTPLIRLL